MMGQEEQKDGEIKQNEKVRPTSIARFSGFSHESEVLFAPLSSFKIDSLPVKIVHSTTVEYYEIMLEYIDTFIPTKQMLFMNLTNAFS